MVFVPVPLKLSPAPAPAAVIPVVPETVKLPPSEVRLLPLTVKVLSRVVAPCSVNAPGVEVEPIVLADEAPLPKVLVSDEPVPSVVAPLEVSVVKAPVEGVPAPIGVLLIEAKTAAPAPLTDHCASVSARSDPDDAPMVIVPPELFPIVVLAVPLLLIRVVPTSVKPPLVVVSPEAVTVPGYIEFCTGSCRADTDVAGKIILLR